jgi:carboxypeptidase Q
VAPGLSILLDKGKRMTLSRMMLGSGLGIVLAVGNAGQTPDEVATETRAAIKNVIGSSLVDGLAYDYDRQLSDEIGARLTGGDAYGNAVAWAGAKFRAAGLEDVRTEHFKMPSLWEPIGIAKARLLAPREQTLHLASMGWSLSTPEGGIRGKVFYISDLLATEHLKADVEKIRGAIVLLDRASYGRDQSPLFGKIADALELLKDLGAQAAVFGRSAENNVESTTSFTLDGSLSPLPEAALGKEDFELLRRLSEKGPVEIEFSFKNRVRGPTEVSQVIAEIRGREKPEEWILVGGHLDSWHPGTGAQDNGTGASSVIEAARAVQALHRPPRRSMRFVLFGGEEQGLVGSNAYVKEHLTEMDNCKAVLITDTGSEAPRGWLVFGREDVKQALQPIGTLLGGLGGAGTSDGEDVIFSSDQGGFVAQGVPALLLWTDREKYSQIHHRPGDTFDKVDKHALAEGAAILAATAYAIADGERFAKHLSKEEIEAVLRRLKRYEEYSDLKEHDGL